MSEPIIYYTSKIKTDSILGDFRVYLAADYKTLTEEVATRKRMLTRMTTKASELQEEVEYLKEAQLTADKKFTKLVQQKSDLTADNERKDKVIDEIEDLAQNTLFGTPDKRVLEIFKKIQKQKEKK